MHKPTLIVVSTLILLTSCLYVVGQADTDDITEIHITLSPAVSDTAISGRLHILFDQNIYSIPKNKEMPSGSRPWFSVDVNDWNAGETITVDSALGYPFELSTIPEGDYIVQAVFDINTTDLGFASAPGNIYCDAVAAPILGGGYNSVSIALDKVMRETEVAETAFMHTVRLQSDLLSQFHGRPVFLEASVFLPPGYYRDTDKKYAAVFTMPGYGSPYTSALRGDHQIRRYGMNVVGEEKVFVFLDQECPLGYHVYADSDNNGPWATAFVEEFIPYFESQYRVHPDPDTRFLTGQSSGAWAGLWLQINYPDQFGGVWASSPDPVDFRSFVGVNIYEKGANFFRTPEGEIRELNTAFSAMDRVIGDGWALGTFEGVFSPPDSEGRPRKLWDRDTGVIDEEVANAWKDYDLRLILEENWRILSSRLAGKVHVFVADDDPYGLNGPVHLLKEALSEIDHDMELTIFPAGGHDLWTDAQRERIHRDMDEAVAKKYPK